MNRFAIPVVAFAASAVLGCFPETTLTPADYVDPFVGTAGTGHTTPAAAYPFGMIQAGPDSGRGDWKYCSGYQHGDTNILRFSQTHLSGTGCPDLGDVGLLPFTGDVVPRAKGLRKADECASVGYYAVSFPDCGVRTEITASQRTAVYRFTYAGDAEAKMLFDPYWGVGNLDGWRACAFTTNNVMTATADGAEGSYDRNGWVYRHVAYAVSCSVQPTIGADGVWSFGDAREVIVRIALSRHSPEKARRNLVRDPFDNVRSAARSAWNGLLGRLTAKGSPEKLTAFYTSAYHLYFQPNNLSDADEKPLYSTLSTWDTFRAAHPLYTLVVPEKIDPLVEAMLDQGDRTGFLPIWTLWGLENNCMIGTHSIPVIVDAYLKGFRGFDAKRAMAAIAQTLRKPHANREKERWELLDAYGYYPCDHVPCESASRTLECAYDDACAARLAAALGDKENETYFAKRAANWKNLFDPETGFIRARDSKGAWREPFDPFCLGEWGSGKPRDYTEGNAWQYTWHVMQDPEGLIAALGGREAAARKLEALFKQEKAADRTGFVLDVTGLIGQYAHGNEPSHHIAYFFPFVGRPWRTAEIVREVFDTQYGIAPDGLCGNDDCGQMSAWYLFGAMGFYPFDPCGGTYVVGAPQFEEVSLALPGGKTFRVVAKGLSEKAKYVKSVSLNGKPLSGFSIRHDAITAGGELVFEMTDESPDPAAKIAAKHRVIGEENWYGHRLVKFDFEGREACVVFPDGARAEGNPWTWTIQWWQAFVERTPVLELLKKGWCHAWIDVFDRRGDEEALKTFASFQKFLVDELGFASKTHLVGMSWGGFFSVRYAAAYPENIAKIYLDAPLLNFDGFGNPDYGRIGPWADRKPADGKWTDDPRMPVNKAEAVAQAGIPVMLLYGGKDDVVPPAKNCELFIPRFKAAGGKIAVENRSEFGHHPHGQGPDKLAFLVDFFARGL